MTCVYCFFMNAPASKPPTRVIVLDRKVVGTTRTKKAAHEVVRAMRARGQQAFTFSVADYKKFIDPNFTL